ncbi:MAG TPA: tyrosine-type recombinase/integrase [Pyrinomonadaceae bacterium]|nr:tyrosine-type recombinase/integrase [Pyrinomonadaceae bacterium]
MAIYKRPNSKYYWMKFTFDGELIQQSTKVKNKKDAQTIESAFRTQLALGKIGIKPKKKIDIPTFENAVNDFLEWSKVGNATRTVTHKRYEFACKHLIKFFGQMPVDKLTISDVEKYVFSRSKETSRKTKKVVTRETVNHELKCLKSIFNRLFEQEIIFSNPTKAVKLLPKNDLHFHVLTKEEERLYLFACPPQLQAVASLMLELGMRCKEVYQLKRNDISLESNTLKIEKGKTKSARRTLYLTARARQVLESRMNQLEGQYLFPHNDIDGNQPLETLSATHSKVIENLVFNFRLYDCRHTFATRAVENGMDLVILASLLGHTNLQMVMRYAHPSENHKKEAMKNLENKIKIG